LEGDFGKLDQSVGFIKVDETKWERIWDDLMRKYHYLGYVSVIGSRVKYLITLGARVVGAISFCSGAYKLGPRDKFIGWDEKTRLAMLPGLVNNNRFLILPWVKVKNLASHSLALSLKRLRTDWLKWYEVEPLMVETFVDAERHKGTCYVAENWISLGMTKGFGRQGNSFVYHGRIREIFVKILNRRFANAFQPDVSRLEDPEAEIIEILNGIPLHYPGALRNMGITEETPEFVRKRFQEHIRPYTPFLHRKEVIEHFIIVLHGLLSDLDRKSIEPILLAFGEPKDVRCAQNFITRSPWDHDGMLKAYREEVIRLFSDENGMLTGDECDFPKKGNMSAGVASQGRGSTGNKRNCQAGVMLGVVGDKGPELLDARLYMPIKWFSDEDGYPEKREKCRVPEELFYKTKNQILLEMIDELIKSGDFKGRHVGVDDAFGTDHEFLDSLPSGLVYFADVPCSHKVYPERPQMILPVYRGRGPRSTRLVPTVPSASVQDLANDERFPWNDVALGIGSKRPIVARDKLIRIVESRGGEPGKDVWLYARRHEDGSFKFALCNESVEASLEDVRKLANQRWSIELRFKECMEYLGMDHYEVRTWHGWRRYMLLVFIAHLFANKLRLEFSLKSETEGSTPVVSGPEPLADFSTPPKSF
jgi:SRSO17 transposase